MKIARTRNATRNIIFGIILKLYQIVMPFLMRTAMIYAMGVEYLGLDSLFTSILQVLNLAELGVGSAMVYGMYRPIAEDDTVTICALMKLYKTYYRIIGCLIAVAGIALTPFIPYLIKSDLPNGLNIYVLYLLNLATTVFSYWLFAYKNALFQAHQRIDVVSKISLGTYTFRYGCQFIVIFFIKDYYLYIIAMLSTQILTNIVTAIAATKMYPSYKPIGKLDPDHVKIINQRIRDLFTSKLGSVIVNSADTIVISAFLGLTVLAIYQNYYFILTSIIGVVTIVFNACTAGIGNSIIVESKDKNYNDFKKFTFLIAWIAGFCTCCFLCLYQPFMKIWIGEDLMLEFPAVICFCVYYFVSEINQLFNTYKDAAGIWHEDRFRPLVTALTNLVMNLILVQFWGIYGVLLSTVFSTLIVGMPWLIHNLFTVLFRREAFSDYLKKIVKYVTVVLISCLVCFFMCNIFELSGWLILLERAILCLIVPNLIYLVAYHNMTEFKQFLQLLDNVTKYKFHLQKRFDLKWCQNKEKNMIDDERMKNGKADKMTTVRSGTRNRR